VCCHYGSAVWWCKDDVDIVCLDDTHPIADTVHVALNTCHTPDFDFSTLDRPMGRICSMDLKINVIVNRIAANCHGA
jgi:hypothetical protein